MIDVTLNLTPNLLPTQKEWVLICTLIKKQQAEIFELKKIVEDTIGQAFYEDDYHKAKAEIETLKKELALQRLSDISQEIERA